MDLQQGIGIRIDIRVSVEQYFKASYQKRISKLILKTENGIFQRGNGIISPIYVPAQKLLFHNISYFYHENKVRNRPNVSRKFPGNSRKLYKNSRKFQENSRKFQENSWKHRTLGDSWKTRIKTRLGLQCQD